MASRRAAGSVVLTAFALVMLAAHAGCAAPQRPLRGPMPPDGIVFATGFEGDRWYREWGREHAPANAEIVAEEDTALGFVPYSGKALRVTIREGGHLGMGDLFFDFPRQFGAEPDEIHFAYAICLAGDFAPVSGGKLPGISGTYRRAGWGGRPADGRNGWSARGAFTAADPDGRVRIGTYCYHADMTGTTGDRWLWGGPEDALVPGRWYRIEQTVRLNTPGRHDGVIRGWIDGRLVFERTDLRFRDIPELRIDRVWMDVYHGGRPTAVRDHHLYIDDVVITRPGPATVPAGGQEGVSAVYSPPSTLGD